MYTSSYDFVEAQELFDVAGDEASKLIVLALNHQGHGFRQLVDTELHAGHSQITTLLLDAAVVVELYLFLSVRRRKHSNIPDFEQLLQVLLGEQLGIGGYSCDGRSKQNDCYPISYSSHLCSNYYEFMVKVTSKFYGYSFLYRESKFISICFYGYVSFYQCTGYISKGCSSISIYLSLSRIHFSCLELYIIYRELNQRSGLSVSWAKPSFLVYKKVVLNSYTPADRARQRQAAQSFTWRWVQSSVRILRKIVHITLYISTGRFRKSFTFALSKLTFILSDLSLGFQASSSTASSITSPKSPIIYIAQQRHSSSFAFQTKLQKISANIGKSLGQSLRQFLQRGKTLLQRQFLGHCSTTLMTVLMINLAQPYPLFNIILVNDSAVSMLISSSYMYSAISLITSASFSVLINFYRILIFPLLTQLGSPNPKKKRLKQGRNEAAPKVTIKYYMCFRTTNYISGVSLLRRANRLLRRTFKACQVNVGLSFIILMNILLIERATADEEVLSLGQRVDRILMIYSSVLGSQSSKYCRITGNCRSPKPLMIDSKQRASFLLITIPYYSISFIAYITVHTKLASGYLIISQKRFRMLQSRTGVYRALFFQTISLVSPITQLFLTSGLKSLSP